MAMFRETLLIFCAISSGTGQSPNSPAIDWIQRNENGAYQFGYATGDEGKHYHLSSATADNTVAGKFGYKDPETGGDLQTTYTAGRSGFRARGPHIARRMDLSQNKPPLSRPNDDGKYHPELDNVFDPNEDRGYDFAYRTPDQIKEEHANSIGNVQGRYSYLDDVGIKHDVEYIAGSGTGFQVTNPVPDTFAQAQGGPLYFVGKRPNPKARGFHAVQKGLDGSYRFVASGPDQKRSEVSDALGNRRGSYTYLDDKGLQRTVEYIAGPNIGYKVINNIKGTNYNPAVYPYYPEISTTGPALSLPNPSSTPSSVSTEFPFNITPISPTIIPSGIPSDLSTPGSSNLPDLPSPELSTPLPPVSSVSPTFPTSTLFPSSERPPPSSTPSFPSPYPSPPFPTSQKWDFDTDSLFKPGFPPPKDWSKHTGGSTPGSKIPSSTPGSFFPSYDPHLDLPNSRYPPDFNFLHHQLFPGEGLNTAETAAGLKPPFKTNHLDHNCTGLSFPIPDDRDRFPGYDDGVKTRFPSKPHVNVYRGDVKFGGVRKYGVQKNDDGYFRIPTGLAVRAHVQSLDIVPYSKRFVSPGEALERFSSHERH